jgi:hypothetical protein
VKVVGAAERVAEVVVKDAEARVVVVRVAVVKAVVVRVAEALEVRAALAKVA